MASATLCPPATGPLYTCAPISRAQGPTSPQPAAALRDGALSLLPTHLEAVVEDPSAPQQPSCPFEGTGGSRKVEPLRWAGDDSENKGRCPLPVQRVCAPGGKATAHNHSLRGPPSSRTGLLTPSGRGGFRCSQGMQPVLIPGGVEMANLFVSFPLSALVLICL